MTGDAIADVTLLDVNFGAVVYPQLPVDPNSPPVANAGPDRRVEEREWVLLNGLGSSDPDGDRLTASWTQVSGPPVVLHFPQSFTPVFQAPKTKRGRVILLQFQLTVTDPSGATNSDVVDVSVVD